MKKDVIASVSILLLVVSMSSFRIEKATAGTIIVPDDFSTIQEAINNANDGDTVFVRNGTYEEDVVINKSISLLGENKLGTIVSGRNEPDEVIIRIEACNVLISGFTTRRGYIGIGVAPDFGANNTLITDNIVDANRLAGIMLAYNYNVTIVGNTISNTYGYLSSTAIGGACYGNATKIYHNNIIQNDVLMDSARGIWDDGYPSGGNFWWFVPFNFDVDLCSGPYQNESGSDGISDNPRIVSDWTAHLTYDRYPLIFPFGYVPKPDLNSDGVIDIFDIVPLAVAYSTRPGDSSWNPYVDLNQDSIIDIFDLVAIAVIFGEAYPPP